MVILKTVATAERDNRSHLTHLFSCGKKSNQLIIRKYENMKACGRGGGEEQREDSNMLDKTPATLRRGAFSLVAIDFARIS